MKKIRTILWITACSLCSLLLLSGCAWLLGGENSSSSSTAPKNTVNITVKVKYEGKADEGCFAVPVGEEFTLRAYDTDEYEFAFWERAQDGEPIFDEAEHTVTAKQDTTYYAVFAPKADDQVLVNVVYERDFYAQHYYYDVGVLGEGYQRKGEEIDLVSDGELPVSWFTVRENWLSSFEEEAHGPALTLEPEKSVTVFVTFEQVCEIVLADSPNYTLYFKDGDTLMNQDELLSVGMHVADGYVADRWEIVWYPTPSAAADGFRVATREEGINWGKEWTYDWHIESLCRRMEFSLIVTNENLSEPYQVEVIKEEGHEPGMYCTMSIPDYFLMDATYSGYYMGIYPSRSSYIKSIYLATRKDANEEFSNSVNLYYSAYAGGMIHIPDDSKYHDYEDVVVRIELVSKETHALVNVISCNEEIVNPAPIPSDFYYAPSISKQSFVVEKGTSKEFYMLLYKNNFEAIYMAGYQFSHVADGKGNLVSETIEFAYTPTEDTDLYIHYERKPIADEFFDYHLSEKGDGYEVRMSQLAAVKRPYADTLTIPSTYNGLPVVEIPDFGLSYYQVTGNGMRSGYGANVYGTLYVPASIKRIGEKAFANSSYSIKIVFDENATFDEISPDAFYSNQNSVKANMTKAQLESVVKSLHEIYIGDADGFELRFEPVEHFTGEGVVGHYEGFAEYICIRADDFDFANISPNDFWKIFHELAHHYQFVAMYGVGEETYESLLIQPTQEDVAAWKQAYDTEDYDAYWTHPMEIFARAFAAKWSGVYRA